MGTRKTVSVGGILGSPLDSLTVEAMEVRASEFGMLEIEEARERDDPANDD